MANWNNYVQSTQYDDMNSMSQDVNVLARDNLEIQRIADEKRARLKEIAKIKRDRLNIKAGKPTIIPDNKDATLVGNHTNPVYTKDENGVLTQRDNKVYTKGIINNDYDMAAYAYVLDKEGQKTADYQGSTSGLYGFGANDGKSSKMGLTLGYANGQRVDPKARYIPEFISKQIDGARSGYGWAAGKLGVNTDQNFLDQKYSAAEGKVYEGVLHDYLTRAGYRTNVRKPGETGFTPEQMVDYGSGKSEYYDKNAIKYIYDENNFAKTPEEMQAFVERGRELRNKLNNADNLEKAGGANVYAPELGFLGRLGNAAKGAGSVVIGAGYGLADAASELTGWATGGAIGGDLATSEEITKFADSVTGYDNRITGKAISEIKFDLETAQRTGDYYSFIKNAGIHGLEAAPEFAATSIAYVASLFMPGKLLSGFTKVGKAVKAVESIGGKASTKALYNKFGALGLLTNIAAKQSGFIAVSMGNTSQQMDEYKKEYNKDMSVDRVAGTFGINMLINNLDGFIDAGIFKGSGLGVKGLESLLRSADSSKKVELAKMLTARGYGVAADTIIKEIPTEVIQSELENIATRAENLTDINELKRVTTDNKAIEDMVVSAAVTPGSVAGMKAPSALKDSLGIAFTGDSKRAASNVLAEYQKELKTKSGKEIDPVQVGKDISEKLKAFGFDNKHIYDVRRQANIGIASKIINDNSMTDAEKNDKIFEMVNSKDVTYSIVDTIKDLKDNLKVGSDEWKYIFETYKKEKGKYVVTDDEGNLKNIIGETNYIKYMQERGGVPDDFISSDLSVLGKNVKNKTDKQLRAMLILQNTGGKIKKSIIDNLKMGKNVILGSDFTLEEIYGSAVEEMSPEFIKAAEEYQDSKTKSDVQSEIDDGRGFTILDEHTLEVIADRNRKSMNGHIVNVIDQLKSNDEFVRESLSNKESKEAVGDKVGALLDLKKFITSRLKRFSNETREKNMNESYLALNKNSNADMLAKINVIKRYVNDGEFNISDKSKSEYLKVIDGLVKILEEANKIAVKNENRVRYGHSLSDSLINKIVKAGTLDGVNIDKLKDSVRSLIFVGLPAENEKVLDSIKDGPSSLYDYQIKFSTGREGRKRNFTVIATVKNRKSIIDENGVKQLLKTIRNISYNHKESYIDSNIKNSNTDGNGNKTKTENKTKTNTSTNTENKTKIENKTKTETKTETKTNTNTNAKTNTKTNTENKTKIENKTKTDTKTNTNTNTENKTKTETKTNTEAKTKTNTDTKTEINTKTEAETDTKTETKTEAKTENKTNTKTENKTDTNTNTKTEAETKTEAKTENNTKIETNTKTETKTETKTDNNTKTKTETKTETETDKVADVVEKMRQYIVDIRKTLSGKEFAKINNTDKSVQDLIYNLKMEKSVESFNKRLVRLNENRQKSIDKYKGNNYKEPDNLVKEGEKIDEFFKDLDKSRELAKKAKNRFEHIQNVIAKKIGANVELTTDKSVNKDTIDGFVSEFNHIVSLARQLSDDIDIVADKEPEKVKAYIKAQLDIIDSEIAKTEEEITNLKDRKISNEQIQKDFIDKGINKFSIKLIASRLKKIMSMLRKLYAKVSVQKAHRRKLIEMYKGIQSIEREAQNLGSTLDLALVKGKVIEVTPYEGKVEVVIGDKRIIKDKQLKKDGTYGGTTQLTGSEEQLNKSLKDVANINEASIVSKMINKALDTGKSLQYSFVLRYIKPVKQSLLSLDINNITKDDAADDLGNTVKFQFKNMIDKLKLDIAIGKNNNNGIDDNGVVYHKASLIKKVDEIKKKMEKMKSNSEEFGRSFRQIQALENSYSILNNFDQMFKPGNNEEVDRMFKMYAFKYALELKSGANSLLEKDDFTLQRKIGDDVDLYKEMANLGATTNAFIGDQLIAEMLDALGIEFSDNLPTRTKEIMRAEVYSRIKLVAKSNHLINSIVDGDGQIIRSSKGLSFTSANYSKIFGLVKSMNINNEDKTDMDSSEKLRLVEKMFEEDDEHNKPMYRLEPVVNRTMKVLRGKRNVDNQILSYINKENAIPRRLNKSIVDKWLKIEEESGTVALLEGFGYVPLDGINNYITKGKQESKNLKISNEWQQLKEMYAELGEEKFYIEHEQTSSGRVQIAGKFNYKNSKIHRQAQIDGEADTHTVDYAIESRDKDVLSFAIAQGLGMDPDKVAPENILSEMSKLIVIGGDGSVMIDTNSEEGKKLSDDIKKYAKGGDSAVEVMKEYSGHEGLMSIHTIHQLSEMIKGNGYAGLEVEADAINSGAEISQSILGSNSSIELMEKGGIFTTERKKHFEGYITKYLGKGVKFSMPALIEAGKKHLSEVIKDNTKDGKLDVRSLSKSMKDVYLDLYTSIGVQAAVHLLDVKSEIEFDIIKEGDSILKMMEIPKQTEGIKSAIESTRGRIEKLKNGLKMMSIINLFDDVKIMRAAAKYPVMIYLYGGGNSTIDGRGRQELADTKVIAEIEELATKGKDANTPMLNIFFSGEDGKLDFLKLTEYVDMKAYKKAARQENEDNKEYIASGKMKARSLPDNVANVYNEENVLDGDWISFIDYKKIINVHIKPAFSATFGQAILRSMNETFKDMNNMKNIHKSVDFVLFESVRARMNSRAKAIIGDRADINGNLEDNLALMTEYEINQLERETRDSGEDYSIQYEEGTNQGLEKDEKRSTGANAVATASGNAAELANKGRSGLANDGTTINQKVRVGNTGASITITIHLRDSKVITNATKDTKEGKNIYDAITMVAKGEMFDEIGVNYGNSFADMIRNGSHTASLINKTNEILSRLTDEEKYDVAIALVNNQWDGSEGSTGTEIKRLGLTPGQAINDLETFNAHIGQKNKNYKDNKFAIYHFAVGDMPGVDDVDLSHDQELKFDELKSIFEIANDANKIVVNGIEYDFIVRLGSSNENEFDVDMPLIKNKIIDYGFSEDVENSVASLEMMHKDAKVLYIRNEGKGSDMGVGRRRKMSNFEKVSGVNFEKSRAGLISVEELIEANEQYINGIISEINEINIEEC